MHWVLQVSQVTLWHCCVPRNGVIFDNADIYVYDVFNPVYGEIWEIKS